MISKSIAADKSLAKDISHLKEVASQIVEKINSLSIDNLLLIADKYGIRKVEKQKENKKGLKPLPNVKDKVVLRLPPEPSGFMHLGHAISGMINFLYKEKYGGFLWLRFEDTNPNLVKDEFVKSFEEGYDWLGIKWEKIHLF